MNAIISERFEDVWSMLHVSAYRLERRKPNEVADGSMANSDIPLYEDERANKGS